MSLEQRSKKELVEIIQQLKEQVKALRPVEAQLTAKTEELKQHAVGLHKDENGKFHLVKLRFDGNTKAAGIHEIQDLESSDPAIALFKINQYVAEIIMRKTRGGKYD